MKCRSDSPQRVTSLLVTLTSLVLWLALPAASIHYSEARIHAWNNPASPGLITEPLQQSELCQSVTGQLYPCESPATIENRESSAKLATSEICKVAVFDQESIGTAQNLANVLNTDPEIQATAIAPSTLESGGLAGFDAVVVRIFDTVTASTAQALQTFVAGGGGYIGEWWGAGAALSGLGTPVNFNYVPPSRFLALFTGLASDGFVIESDHPIMVTASHSVVQGLPSVFSAGGGTEFFVRAIPPFDPRLTQLATYDGYGGTNPAIMVGNTGGANVVLLFFDAIDNPGDLNLKQLWINSVKFACGGTQFDLCIQDESRRLILRVNSTTGQYSFTNCSGLTLGGTGTLTRKGSILTLQHNASDRRVLSMINLGASKATASIQVFSVGRTYTITDRNINNNTCICP